MTGNEIIELIKATLPMSQSIISAIGGAIFTSIFLRKNTATQEFEKLKAGKMQEVADDLLNTGKMTFTEYYKANNFLVVAKLADKEFAKIKHDAMTHTYDFDWFMRFYEAVGNVSDEDMQLMWAKILAGEVNKPKSYSYRTIDLMHNFDKQDADLFTKICKHSIKSKESIYLPNYNDYLNKCNISYSDILRLDEIGLINSSGLINLTMHIVDKQPAFIINENLIMIIIANGNANKCSIKQFPFTKIGIEISALTEAITSDDDFILFAKEVSKNPSISVEVHRISNLMEEYVNYETENLLKS